MAEPSSGKDEAEVTKSNSFTKFLTSPASDNSPKKKSSNPLTKLLRRKSSKKGEDKGGEASSPDVVDSEPIEEEDEKDESLVEEVKEVVETAFHDLIHRKKKETSPDHTSDATISIKSRDKSSSSSSSEEDTKERKHDFIGKFKVGFGKAKEGLKEEYSRAKDELKSALSNDKRLLAEQHHQLLDIKKPEITAETPIDEVKAPNIAQRIQEEVAAVVNTIGDTTKGKTPVPQEKTPIPQEETLVPQEESNEIKEEKKEDNCVSSLAKGLQSFCSWGSKKED